MHSIIRSNTFQFRILLTVFDRYISSFLEFKDRVFRKLLAVSLTVGLCPSHFAWVTLLLEITVAFRSAKPEYLFIAHICQRPKFLHAMISPNAFMIVSKVKQNSAIDLSRQGHPCQPPTSTEIVGNREQPNTQRSLSVAQMTQC